MPLNKNASFRYRVIDQCLGRKYKRYTLEDLISEVSHELREQFGLTQGVSKRTIQSDLQIMRSLPPRGFGAEIICEAGEYFYLDPSYSILNAPLNKIDINALNEISILLGQFKMLPHFGRLNQMLRKLKGFSERQYYERDVVCLEINQYVAGTEFLPLVFESLIGRIQLKIVYKPFKEEVIRVFVHPFLLKEYNNRWYLLCQSDHREGLSLLALDRMLEIQQIEGQAMVCPIDTNTYYSNVVGVTIPEHATIEEVHFSISEDRLPYLQTKPVHSTQQIEMLEEKVVVKLQVIINKELKAELLSLSPDIKVLQPQHLVSEMQELFQQSLAQYR
ncbi:MAG: WYL domain-containing protein [Bacteroidales bacterium]|nr:WYL domain-containing protein [Bacteroidales bacterium]